MRTSAPTSFAELRGADLAEVAGAADLAVVPLGAVEWHGPHLPFGTDLLVAQGLAAEAFGTVRAVVFPAVAYTACPGKTRGRPGTIAIRPEVAVAYLSDVLDGIVAAGFTRVLVLNGHDANMGTARAAMEWVSGLRRSSFLLVNWFQLVPAAETTALFGDDRARGHGGAYETSACWSFAPDAVDPRGVEDLPPRPPLATPHAHTLVESSPDPWDGWSGLVSLASRQAGDEVRRRAGARLAELVGAWLDAPLPSAPASPPADHRTPP